MKYNCKSHKICLLLSGCLMFVTAFNTPLLRFQRTDKQLENWSIYLHLHPNHSFLLLILIFLMECIKEKKVAPRFTITPIQGQRASGKQCESWKIISWASILERINQAVYGIVLTKWAVNLSRAHGHTEINLLLMSVVSVHASPLPFICLLFFSGCSERRESRIEALIQSCERKVSGIKVCALRERRGNSLENEKKTKRESIHLIRQNWIGCYREGEII